MSSDGRSSSHTLSRSSVSLTSLLAHSWINTGHNHCFEMHCWMAGLTILCLRWENLSLAATTLIFCGGKKAGLLSEMATCITWCKQLKALLPPPRRDRGDRFGDGEWEEERWRLRGFSHRGGCESSPWTLNLSRSCQAIGDLVRPVFTAIFSYVACLSALICLTEVSMWIR